MLFPVEQADEPLNRASAPLEQLIRDRITRRLGRRVRGLTVGVENGVVRLSGSCSTYYTKQLAQNAVLGVIEDETIDNRLVVTTGTPAANA